jgi:hypothetical protein
MGSMPHSIKKCTKSCAWYDRECESCVIIKIGKAITIIAENSKGDVK